MRRQQSLWLYKAIAFIQIFVDLTVRYSASNVTTVSLFELRRIAEYLLADYEKTLNSITYDEIRDLAKKLLDSGNVIQVTMRPEAQPEADE